MNWEQLMSKKRLTPFDVESVRDAYRAGLDATDSEGSPAPRQLRNNIGGEEVFFGSNDFVGVLFELEVPDVGLPTPPDSDARLLFWPTSNPVVSLIQVVRDGRDAYLQLSNDGTDVPFVDMAEGHPHSFARLAFWVLDNPDLMDKTPKDVRTKGELRNQSKAKPDRPRSVTVVELRSIHRANSAAVREAERTYRSRWVVRGHWHNFWTGKRDGERVLKPRYVMPYVKGPAGAPLNVTEKVGKW